MLNEFERLRSKEKKKAEEDHEGAADKIGPRGIFCRESDFVDAPQCEPEDDEIVKHVEKNIQGGERLLLHEGKMIELQNFCVGLGNADGAGELYNVYRESKGDDAQEEGDAEGSFRKRSNAFGETKTLLCVDNFAYSACFAPFVEKKESASEREYADKRSDDAVHGNKVPRGKPNV